MKKHIKHIARALLPVLAIALAACACGGPGPRQPLAVKGRIDLSNRDFVRDAAVDLKGEWEFYRMRLVPPEDFTRPGGPLLV
jgi:hypothetical protein